MIANVIAWSESCDTCWSDTQADQLALLRYALTRPSLRASHRWCAGKCTSRACPGEETDKQAFGWRASLYFISAFAGSVSPCIACTRCGTDRIVLGDVPLLS